MLSSQDQSFVFMLANYTKRFSLTNYGGIAWSLITGFEQVVSGSGVATYYVIDYSAQKVVIFNQYWVYQSYKALNALSYPYDLRLVGAYFYISANDFFYRTDAAFNVQNPSYSYANAIYRQIYYDSANSKFYVVANNLNQIHVFNTLCSFLQAISLSYSAYGINYYNGKLYVSLTFPNQVLIIQNGVVSSQFTVSQCNSNLITAIAVDSYGYLALSCSLDNQIFVYDYNGNYQNIALTSTTNMLYNTNIDASGRYVLMDGSYLDIYY